MAGASTHTMNAILDSLLRGRIFSQPARVSIALHTADPGVNEVTSTVWPAYLCKDAAEGSSVEAGFNPPAYHDCNRAIGSYPKEGSRQINLLLLACQIEARSGDDVLCQNLFFHDGCIGAVIK